LASSVGRSRAIDRDFTFANSCLLELWFGTHVGGPSKIILGDSSTELLSDHIKKNPTNVLGEKVAQQWNNNLPFLFKVTY
jgi:mannose-6-phosphate isomerase class I